MCTASLPFSVMLCCLPAQVLVVHHDCLKAIQSELTGAVCPCREEEPNWDQDIAGDVKDECSKYGAVGHVHVDRNSKVLIVC